MSKNPQRRRQRQHDAPSPTSSGARAFIRSWTALGSQPAGTRRTTPSGHSTSMAPAFRALRCTGSATSRTGTSGLAVGECPLGPGELADRFNRPRDAGRRWESLARERNRASIRKTSWPIHRPDHKRPQCSARCSTAAQSGPAKTVPAPRLPSSPSLKPSETVIDRGMGLSLTPAPMMVIFSRIPLIRT